MLSPPLEQCWRFNLKSIDFFDGPINNGKSIELGLLFFFLFKFEFLLFRLILFFLSLPLISQFNISEVEVFKLVGMRVPSLKTLGELAHEVASVDLVGLVVASQGLAPIPS